MAPLTFAATHDMVAYLCKSDASEGFDQIIDFLNAHTIHYALVVNPTIYVSCIKKFWATATIKKVNDVVQLRALIDGKKVVVSEDVIRRDLHFDDADGAFFSAQWKFLIHTLVQCLSAKKTAWNEFSCSMVSAVICLATSRKFNFSKYIFDSMLRNVDSPSKFLMYPCFLQVVMDNQADDMTSHNTRYTSLALTQKVFANMRRVGKGFSRVETPLFALMLVQPQQAEEEEVAEQPSLPHDSTMPLLTQDKYTQALGILKLKKRVKKLKKKKRSKHSWLKRLRKVGTSQRVKSSNDTVVGSQEDASKQGEIEAIDVDEEITLVDIEKDKEVITMGTEPQGRLDQKEVNAASKGVSAAEPTVFDDEEVTMTMAQTLIKLKIEKAKLLDEQIAQKLYDEEV
nr:hypothetical protein [Tanacetum cinerariifolium]